MLISGYDTETYEGYVKLITCTIYDSETNKYEQSYLESSDTDTLLDFIYEHSRYADYSVFFNVNYDISAILKPFIVNNISILRDKFYKYIALGKEYKTLNNKVVKDKKDFSRLAELETELSGNKPMDFKTDIFNVSVISGKSFSLKRKGKHKVKIYIFDIANFYRTNHDGFMSLDSASQKFLGEKKNNAELSIDRKKIGEEQGYYEKYRDKIIEYGLQDSYLTARLLVHTIQSYKNIGINFPLKPYSKASVSRQYMKDNYDDEYLRSQKFYEQFDSIADFKKYYNGGYFRVFAVGKFSNVVNRDIRSAYPYAISKLYSLTGATLVNYQDKDFNLSDYTFYEIKTSYTPLLQTRIVNSIYYIEDKEEHTYYITGLDKEILDMTNTKYTIISAYGIITRKKLIFPNFAHLYDYKNEVKKKFGGESAEYMNIKIVMNGFYGILAQSKPYITKYTNYVYASYITAMCRNIILKEYLNIRKEQEIIQISTDSVMYSEQKPVSYPVGEKLGDIEQEKYDYAIVYGSGIYLFSKHNKIENRRRGFSDIDFSYYTEVSDTFITSEHSRPMHILESIIQQIPDSIAKFKTEKRIFNPVKALSQKYNTENIRGWALLDFTINKAKIGCYKISEVVKSVCKLL
jgi:hypothetical protein